MQEQSNTMDVHEQLSAFFDGELNEHERATLEAELEREPEFAAALADLAFMREIVVGDLEYQAERVPEARFEQIWDNFELALDRESRLQEAAEVPPSLWQRLVEWMGPRRIPLTAVGLAGVLGLVFVWSAGAPSDEPTMATNTQDEGASDATPGSTPPAPAEPSPAPTLQPSDGDRIAVAPEPPSQVEPEVFPQPEPGEAEIRRIEFGGHVGTISQVEGARGTTTVIWVTEDETPVDSERSL